MKLWKKIFIYSMTLFLIIFNGAGVFLIESIHKKNLESTIKTAIDEHKLVESTIYLNTDSFENMSPTSDQKFKDSLSFVINGYILNNSLMQDSLELYDENNNLLFSRSNEALSIPSATLNEIRLSERLFMIKDIDNIHYVFISSKFIFQDKTIKLILTEDIDSIYKERDSNYKLYIALNGVILSFLAIGMYIIAKGTTKPIVKLSEASKEIAYGNYSKRVKIKYNKDELGLLAENFNMMAQATEDTIDELQNLSSEKQRFIDSLTHELKTPLTSIIGYSDLLMKGNINEDIRLIGLNYINSESKRLEKLSTTLLKLILIKRENLTAENLSIKDCVMNAYVSQSFIIENKNLKIKIDIQDTEIIGDKQLIIVLFINILDNAIKASNNNGDIEIKGDFLNNSSTYQLAFKDYGIGIPKEDLNKIKEPFYMVDKARDRSKQGIGLGLALCDEICKVHNISLNIDSEPNNGTTILISFCKENDIS